MKNLGRRAVTEKKKKYRRFETRMPSYKLTIVVGDVTIPSSNLKARTCYLTAPIQFDSRNYLSRSGSTQIKVLGDFQEVPCFCTK